MNSILLKDNLKVFLSHMENDDILLLTDMSVKYHDFMKDGDIEQQKSMYKKILDYVQRQENLTGVKILSSTDNSFILAINALSGMFQKFYEKQELKMKPEKKILSFKSIAEADIWLHNNPNMAVERMDIETDSSWGLFANHSYADSVTLHLIDYKKPTGYIYGICEEEQSSYFFKQSREKFIYKWRKENPEKELLSIQNVTNTRGSSGSMMTGWGVNQNVSYFILYRREV